MNEKTDMRQWFKKKRFIIPLAIIATSFALGSTSTPSDTQVSSVVPTANVQKTVVNPYQTNTNTSNKLSNDNYYTNTAGNEVHSPAYSNSAPIGASAQCRDGTYSFSQSRRGTCSHHGGVSEWL